MLNRCATYSDSGLTLAELGLQAARPQTSPVGAKPSAPLDHEELELDGQKVYHCVSARLAYLASDRPAIASVCKECIRAVRKAMCADLARLKRIGRYLLHTPRAVWEYLLQNEESIVMVMLTLLVARKRDARHLEDACALDNTPWQLGCRHRKWCH